MLVHVLPTCSAVIDSCTSAGRLCIVGGAFDPSESVFYSQCASVRQQNFVHRT